MQTIYSFRGASPTFMSTVSDTLSSKLYTLATNRRCSEEVIDVCNGVIIGMGKTNHVNGLGKKGKVNRLNFATKDQEVDWITENVKLNL
jgi:ATP-dependent exoDNAse (exonuclease V) beta subunit